MPDRDMLERVADEAAQDLSERYGRARVENQPDGSIIVTGMTDDVDRERVRLAVGSDPDDIEVETA